MLHRLTDKVLPVPFIIVSTEEASGPVVSSDHWETLWIVATAVGLLTALLVALLMVGTALTTITGRLHLFLNTGDRFSFDANVLLFVTYQV